MNDIELYPDERLDVVNEKITLIQKKDGLTFGTDAFLLASYIKPLSRGVAVELGTGTGIISLLLAVREKFSKIYALEIQEQFATLAERNAKFNSLDGRVSVLCRDACKVRPHELGGEADVVFSNPPYMKVDSGKRNENDGKYIARHEVCGGIEDFCASAFRLLKHGGKFYAVWRPDRLTDIISAMRNARIEPKTLTFVHADANAQPSMMLISGIKGGASGMTLTPPLLLHEVGDHATLSEKAQKIYDSMSFDGIF